MPRHAHHLYYLRAVKNSWYTLVSRRIGTRTCAVRESVSQDRPDSNMAHVIRHDMMQLLRHRSIAAGVKGKVRRNMNTGLDMRMGCLSNTGNLVPSVMVVPVDLAYIHQISAHLRPSHVAWDTDKAFRFPIIKFQTFKGHLVRLFEKWKAGRYVYIRKFIQRRPSTSTEIQSK